MSDFWKDSDFARDYQYNYSKNLYGSGNRPTIIVQYGDDGQFVTATTTSLIHYYTKSQTYSAEQIDEMIGAIAGMHFEVVAELPTRSISTTTIYLVPSTNPTSKNVKDEYINLDGTTSGWELIGSTSIDFSDYVTVERLNTILSEYVTGSELRSALSGKVDKITGKGLSTNDYTNAEKSKLADLKNRRTIKDKNGYSVLDRDNVQFTGNVQVVDDASNNKTIVNIQGGGGSGDTVGWNQIQQSGTKIAEISINGSSQNVYAPNGGGGGGSEVSYDPTLTSGTKTGEITIDGVTTNMYAPNPTNVSVSQTLQSGTEIGEISVNGQTTTLYAPNGGGGSSTFAGLSDVSLSNLQDGQVPKYNSTTHKWENADESGGGGSTVAWTQIQQTGTKIAEIDINGTTTDVYAPTGGTPISSDLDVDTIDTADATKTIALPHAGRYLIVGQQGYNGTTVISITGTYTTVIDESATAHQSGETSPRNVQVMIIDAEAEVSITFTITNSSWPASGGVVCELINTDTIGTPVISYTSDGTTTVNVSDLTSDTKFILLGSGAGRTVGNRSVSTTDISKTWFIKDSGNMVAMIGDVVGGGSGSISAYGFDGGMSAVFAIPYTTSGGGGGSEDVELTIAEYIALPDTKLTDNKNYFIKDINNDNVLGYPPLIYSDEEREVGVWRDGKPLYEKTINFGAIPSITTKEVDHNISNLGMVIDFEGMMINADGMIYETLPSGENSNFRIQILPTKIRIITSDSWVAWTDSYITLKYTKTTDTPGSGIWNGQGGIAHHYSTNEQVIGTYFGKPLYEKGFNVGTQSFSSGQMTITNDLSNVDEIVEWGGSAKEPRDNRNIPIPYMRKTWNECLILQVMQLSGGTVSTAICTNDSWYTSLENIKIWVRYTKTTD